MKIYAIYRKIHYNFQKIQETSDIFSEECFIEQNEIVNVVCQIWNVCICLCTYVLTDSCVRRVRSTI